MLTCLLKAVDKHADLLRESAADVGNDHRLGANEAPPAIISIYLGEQLQDVLTQLISTGAATHSISGQKLETGVRTLPDFMKDATDRNRTSPFAFTGNKFEFRMVGAQDSVAQPNVVLNTIVAEAFAEACDVLEAADDFETAVHDLSKNTRQSMSGLCSTETVTRMSGWRKQKDAGCRISGRWWMRSRR